jgi:hypothetical protein
MEKIKTERIARKLTKAEQMRLKQQREQVAAELPDLIARDRLRKEAREELTLSGELRRAVHDSTLSLTAIAARVGVAPLILDEFLSGERTLRSDMMDRLAEAVGFVRPNGRHTVK